MEFNGRALGTLTVSLGVALYPQNGANAAAVIAAADAALYDAKRNGRDQVQEAPGHKSAKPGEASSDKPWELVAQAARQA